MEGAASVNVTNPQNTTFPLVRRYSKREYGKAVDLSYTLNIVQATLHSKIISTSYLRAYPRTRDDSKLITRRDFVSVIS